MLNAAACHYLERRKSYQSNAPLRTESPRTVFCDFDGPIVDVSERYYSTYCSALDHVNSVLQSQHQGRSLHRLTKHQFWQMKCNRIPDSDIAAHSGLQGSQIDIFLEKVQAIVNQPSLLHQDQLQPGVRRALELLYMHHVKLILVSLRHQTQLNCLLEHHGLLHLFAGVYGSQDRKSAYQNCATHKTHLLETAIAHHGVSTAQGQCWMIGDTEADVLAGQAHEIPTFALTCGIRSKAYLSRFHPTRIHKDLLSAARNVLIAEPAMSLVL
ncbi:MAG: HAD family hydrolase [Elainellaceae cyanobacterium]